LLLLPYGEDVKAVEKPHGIMGVKQVMSHLHIILEALKRFVKVFHYAKLSFGASKHGNFLSCPSRAKVSTTDPVGVSQGTSNISWRSARILTVCVTPIK